MNGGFEDKDRNNRQIILTTTQNVFGIRLKIYFWFQNKHLKG